MTFGEKIISARKEKNLTQKQFAQLMGKHIRTVSNWERDLNTPDPQTRRKIARILNLDLENEQPYHDSELFLDERTLVESYRRLDEDGKKLVRGLISTLDTYNRDLQKSVARLAAYKEQIEALTKNR